MNNQPTVQVTIPQITIMLFFICLLLCLILQRLEQWLIINLYNWVHDVVLWVQITTLRVCVFTTINSNNLTHIETANRFLNSSISSFESAFWNG
ncbi:unnamed protein product [Rotaria magnacalcarata]